MFTINPQTMINAHVVYLIQDQNQRDIFIFHCRFTDLLKIKDAVKNPAFDITQNYTINVLEWATNARDASNKFGEQLKKRGWPPLNYTVNYNTLGSIRCNETGQVWRNQSDVVRELGIDSSALSQHLKRVAGFKTIKNLTFSRACYLDENRKATNKTPARLNYVHKTAKAVRCNETGEVFSSQSEACAKMGINRGQLSQHLRGHSGYKTVQNYTFSHIDQVAQSITPINYPQ